MALTPRGWLPWAAAVLCVAAGMARLWPVYTLYTQTFDEPLHVASGMELLDRGTYTHNLVHPPLPRVAVAAGPYWRGARWAEPRNAILHWNQDYWGNLRAARLGTLPFYALACVVVAAWARRWYGDAAAIVAVVLFSALPPVLAHASLAATDLAAAATLAAALLVLTLWIEEPDARRSVWMGLALAAAMLSKTSALPFLAGCGAAALVWRWWRQEEMPARALLRRAPLVLGLAAVLIWAGYGFEGASLSEYRGRHDTIERWFASRPALRRTAVRALEAPLPLGQVVRGFQEVRRLNQLGQVAHLLGETKRHGWWYFFPVVLAVKTPLGFLALAIAGCTALVWGARRRPWPLALPALYALVILLLCMPSRVNMGVRHILAIYPLLAVAAAHAVVLGWRRAGWRRAAVLVLGGWAVVESARAHPDYLPYFNALAGGAPERFQGDSDFDWGQDLERLRRRLRERGVEEISIAYFGTADLEHAGLPRFRDLRLRQDAPGEWVAVSIRLQVIVPRGWSFDWLREYELVETVGKTIRLYRRRPAPA